MELIFFFLIGFRKIPLFVQLGALMNVAAYIFLNLYWFYRITLGIVKALCGSRKGNRKEEVDEDDEKTD